jgi:L-aminopeptidase/D-esterase-like protein
MRTRGVGAVVGALVLGAATLAGAQTPGPNNAITDVPGIKVGHHTGTGTGTTVVLADNNGLGVAGSVTQRGGSPGTRETDLLKPENMVDRINAIVLSGGSAYGLAAASGVMKCLEDLRIGFGVGGGNVVPIVPAAVSFDGGKCGTPASARPDFSYGLQACQGAAEGPVAQGNVGAGAGAVSGGVKGGIGTASVVLENGIVVGAIAAVNSAGSAYDDSGNLYAASLALGDELGQLVPGKGTPPKAAPPHTKPGRGVLRSAVNAVVATNVQLTKGEAIKIAEMADDGVARAIKPSHTPYDGDTIFALGTARISMASLGDPVAVQNQIGAAAADVLSRAIVRAILSAESTACHESYCDRFSKACRKLKK